MAIKVKIVQKPLEVDREAIFRPLLRYNETNAGPANYEPFAIRLFDTKTSVIVGGLWARIYYDWLYVDLIYVPEEARGRDIGSRLISEAEGFARRKRCVGVWLNTYSFQAPGFYRKLGYRAFGTLTDYPRGQKLIFFRKALAGGPPPATEAGRRASRISKSRRHRRLP